MMAILMHLSVWLVALALIVFLIGKRFPEIWKRPARKASAMSEPPTCTVPTVTTKVSSTPPWSALVDGFTHPFTWIAWIALFGGVWLYDPKLLATPNLVWLPLFLWTLQIPFSRARMCSKIKNGGKEKKAATGLTVTVMLLSRLAFLSTLGVIAYYGILAPPGTLKELGGETREHMRHPVRGPDAMIIPEGVPLNPNFTSRKLEGWEVTYIGTNPQYRVPQSAWSGKKLVVFKEPRREVTDVVDLTVGSGYEEALDIHLSGSCQAILDNRRAQISKTCVGWWKDRGSQISGQFYLQVNEGKNRYFNIYLYDGNYLPKKDRVAMMLYGPPIPAIMLQFRSKDWNEDKN